MGHRARLRSIDPLGPAPPRTTRVPRLIAAAVGLAGVITLLSAAFSPLRGRLEFLSDAIPLTVRVEATSVAAMAGLGVLVVAGALARRQRRAWWIATTLLLVAGLSHLLRTRNAFESGISLGMVAVLIMARKEFDAKPAPRSIRRVLLAVPAFAVTVWAFGWVAIIGHADDILPRPDAGRAAVAALRGAIGLPLRLRVVGSSGRWIPGLLPLLGVMVIVVAMVMVFRPVVEGLHRNPADVLRVRGLVERFGSDTLAYFALREDKNYFFHGEAVVAYAYLWSLALVSGDPIGDPKDAPQAIESFVAHARGLGWGVAVLAGGEELAPLYARLGLRPFYLGDEAIVDPTSFSLEGRGIRKVRQSCHRMQRLGFRLTTVPDVRIDPDLTDALRDVTTSWRGRAPERGFTMALGRGPSPADTGCLTVVARDRTGRAQGYLHLVPCYGSQPGYSIDQMRRRPGSPNGMTEWMVAATLLDLGRVGVRRFSLNFAFMGALFRHEARLNLLQRLEVAVVKRLNPFFQIESLHEFNAKFFPSWIPRYIYYEATLAFPRVALAYLEAEAFLRLPLVGARGRLHRRMEPLPASREPGGQEAPSTRRTKAAD